MNKITFLNNKIDNKEATYNGPKYLCKYRSFDKFTFDMLENNYLYLCPAENLDDPTECLTSIELENLYDIENDCLSRECVELILEIIKPYTSNENYELARSLIYKVMTPNYKIRNNFLLDVSFELQELAPKIPQNLFANIINWFANIPDMINSPEIKPQIEGLILKGLSARKDMGICSLAESSDIEDMWLNYTDDSSGYCVVYQVFDYKYNNLLFPVIYDDNRQTNIVMQVVATFLGQMIYAMTNKQIDSDRSQFLRLFTTKNKKWEYQDEWRLIGDSNFKITAPKINKIIIGKNASPEDKIKMIEYCKRNNIQYEIKQH